MDKYRHTPHNLGAEAILQLFPDVAFSANKKLESLVGEYKSGEKIVLLLPQTFMNLSGRAVSRALNFYKIEAADMVVLHDEIDLPRAEIRHKFGGGHRGHNGLRDIIKEIGTADFHRIRLGVGRPDDERISVADYLLRRAEPFAADFFVEVRQLLVDKELLT